MVPLHNDAGSALPRPDRSRHPADHARRLIALLRLAGLGEAEETRSLDDQLARVVTKPDDPAGWWTMESEPARGLDPTGVAMASSMPSDPRSLRRFDPLIAPSWSVAYRDASLRAVVIAARLRDNRPVGLAGRSLRIRGGGPRRLPVLPDRRPRAPRPVGHDRPAAIDFPLVDAAPPATLSAEAPSTKLTLRLRADDAGGIGRRDQDGHPARRSVLVCVSARRRPCSGRRERRRRQPRRPGRDVRPGPHVVPRPRRSRSGSCSIPTAGTVRRPPAPGVPGPRRVDGRDFHRSVPLGLQTSSNRLQVLLSPDPEVADRPATGPGPPRHQGPSAVLRLSPEPDRSGPDGPRRAEGRRPGAARRPVARRRRAPGRSSGSRSPPGRSSRMARCPT